MLKPQKLVELSNNSKTILNKSYSVHSEFPTYFLITSQNLNETYPFYYSSFSWLPCQYNSIWFLLSKVRRIVSVWYLFSELALRKKIGFPLRISSVNVTRMSRPHWLKYSLMENFIFCAVWSILFTKKVFDRILTTPLGVSFQRTMLLN